MLICEFASVYQLIIRTAFYENQKRLETANAKVIDFPKVAKPPFSLAESFSGSPRRSHLARAGDDTLPYRESQRIV